MSSPASGPLGSGPFHTVIVHPEEPLGTIIGRDDQDRESVESLFWTPFHEKAHVLRPTSSKITSNDFLVANKFWLDLLLRFPFDEDAQETVKEHVLRNLDENTARLVPEQYRNSLFLFCGMINEKDLQDALQESPLPEVTVN